MSEAPSRKTLRRQSPKGSQEPVTSTTRGLTSSEAEGTVFVRDLPTQRRVWSASSLAGYMRCPAFYYMSTVQGYGTGGSTDTQFGHFLHGASDVFMRALLEGADTETATEGAVMWALEATDLTPECKTCGGSGFSGYGMGYGDVCGECGGQRQTGPDQFWGGAYRLVWRCDGKVKGKMGRPVKCPKSKQWNPVPEGCAFSEHTTCQQCGEHVREQTIFFPEDKVKNRHTLIRSIVAYCDALSASRIRPLVLEDGRLGSEVPFLRALELIAPDGFPYFFSGSWDGASLRGDEEVVLNEIKTTRKQVNDRYYAQFQPGLQLYLYTLVGLKEMPEKRPKIMKVVLEISQGTTHIHFHTLRVPRDVLDEFERDALHWIKRAEDDALRAKALEEAGQDPALAYHRNITACHSLPGAQGTSCPFRGICVMPAADRPRFLQAGFEKREK